MRSLRIIVAGIVLLCVSGCAQISNYYTMNGDNNKIIATDSVNKSTKDLLDLAGSAYGDADTNARGTTK